MPFLNTLTSGVIGSAKQAVIASVGLGVLYLIISSIYILYFHPLARFPGPKLWILTRIPYARVLMKGRFVHTLRAHHDKYGPIVRISTNELSFTDAQAWQDIYGHHGGEKNFPRNPLWYQPAINNVHSIFSADNANHARIRRLLAHAFSEKALKEQEHLIQTYFDLLMTRLHAQADNRPINIIDWFHFTTFDIAGDLEFGESFGCLQNSQYHPWITVLLSNFRRLIIFGSFKMLPVLRNIVPLLVPRKIQQQRLDHFDYTRAKVGKRLEIGDDPQRADFMSYVCRFNDDKGMTREEIDSTFNTLVVAGSETTASLLTGSIHELLLNPKAFQTLKDEIRGEFKHDSEITINRTARLTYLSAVIEEALRLCTPAPTMLPRLVPAGGARVCGHWLPGGTEVAISPYAMFRSPDNFSASDSFIPERWIGAGGASLDKHKGKALKAFSYGPRSCLGQNLAMLEVRVILSKMIWNFDIVNKGSPYDWKEQETYVVWIKKPLMVGLTAVKR